jgi:hypothetical protein
MCIYAACPRPELAGELRLQHPTVHNSHRSATARQHAAVCCAMPCSPHLVSWLMMPMISGGTWGIRPAGTAGLSAAGRLRRSASRCGYHSAAPQCRSGGCTGGLLRTDCTAAASAATTAQRCQPPTGHTHTAGASRKVTSSMRTTHTHVNHALHSPAPRVPLTSVG